MLATNPRWYNVAFDPAVAWRLSLITMQNAKNPSDNASVRYRRVVVKAGSGLLTGEVGRLDLELMATLVEQISRLHLQRVDVLLVTSGAVAAGRHVLDVQKGGKSLPDRQVLAAVGQGRLMHVYEQLFGKHDIIVAQALLSRRDLSDRLGYLNVRNTLMALLERRVVPIINENDVVAVEELAGDNFGDNDTLSAMCANLVDADLLVLLGEIGGLYTKDPHVDPDARLIPVVELPGDDIREIAGPSWDGKGRGGMTTKLDAAKLATASGVTVVIAGGREPDVLIKLAQGDTIGTLFPAPGSKMESRKRWMLSGLSTRGEIQVDDGAVVALRDRNRSLLPPGVTDVIGTFDRGDIISIVDSRRVQAACGIANYSSTDVNRIKGMRSDRIGEVLEQQFGEEVVHRNNMVVL